MDLEVKASVYKSRGAHVASKFGRYHLIILRVQYIEEHCNCPFEINMKFLSVETHIWRVDENTSPLTNIKHGGLPASVSKISKCFQPETLGRKEGMLPFMLGFGLKSIYNAQALQYEELVRLQFRPYK